VYGSPEIGGLYAASLDGAESRRIVDCDGPGFYLAGHLMFLRHGTLFAQRFDAASLAASGFPAIVANQVAATGQQAAMASSAAGLMAYRTGGGLNTRQMGWADRA